MQGRERQGREGLPEAHGSWSFTIDVDTGAEGRRKQLRRSGFKTSALANEAMTKELAALDAGTWVDDEGITVGEWLDRWLVRLEQVGRSPKTLANYRGHVRDVWKPKLGNLRLRDLRRRHVDTVLLELGQPITEVRPGLAGRHIEQRSPDTIDGYRRTLRAALGEAKAHGLIAVNYAEGKLSSIPEAREPELAFWEPEETAKFLLHVEDDEWSALYELDAYTGLRRQELLGARWSDIDEGDTGITVRQTLIEVSSKDIPKDKRICEHCGQEHKGMHFKQAKSQAGDRWVPLVPQARDVLKAHRVAQQAQRDQLGEDYADHGLVFCLPDGNPIRPNMVTQAFKEHVAACGLQQIRLHDMRHGACSLLLAGGVPIEIVQKILGHSDPAVTRRVYAHVLRGETARQVEEAVKLLDAHRGRPRPVRPETSVTNR